MTVTNVHTSVPTCKGGSSPRQEFEPISVITVVFYAPFVFSRFFHPFFVTLTSVYQPVLRGMQLLSDFPPGVAPLLNQSKNNECG